MKQELPKLGYAFDALEPHIDAKTMEIHYTKHHQAYLDKLLAALSDDEKNLSIEEILSKKGDVPAVRNNGGGFFNHSIFWQVIAPGGAKGPKGQIASAIDSAFGSFDDFQKLFSEKAATQFGSGWAWLVCDKKTKRLDVLQKPNQDVPDIEEKTPLLGIDVWEHAYYLKYQNRRPDYIKAFLNIVNWDEVAKRFAD